MFSDAIWCRCTVSVIMATICNVQLHHNHWCLERNRREAGWLSCWCAKAFFFWLFPIFFRGLRLVEATSLVKESYCRLAKSGSAAKVIYVWFHTYGGGTRTGGIFACRETKVFKGLITWGRSGSFHSPAGRSRSLCCVSCTLQYMYCAVSRRIKIWNWVKKWRKKEIKGVFHVLHYSCKHRETLNLWLR